MTVHGPAASPSQPPADYIPVWGRSIYWQIARRKLHKICEIGPLPLKSFCATRTMSKPKTFVLRFACVDWDGQSSTVWWL